MKLLILSHNPERASFRQRIGIYLPVLKERGADCVVEKLSAGYFARWRLFAQAREFDGVLLHKKTLNFWDARILRKHARKIIYDFDDAIMFSPGNPDSRHSSHYRLFVRTARLADCIIAGNVFLADKARPFCRRVQIVPTGLDTKKFDIPRPSSDGKIRLAWIGSKATLDYLQLLKPVFKNLSQQFPNVVLRIICDAFFDLDGTPVEKRRWSLETEAKDLAACHIGLCPLPDDNFTRGKCGFKILQYAAAGLPTIASPVGINAELVQHGKTGLLAKNADEWLAALKTCIENPVQCQTMGKSAKEFCSKFDQDFIGRQFSDIIIQVIQN